MVIRFASGHPLFGGTWRCPHEAAHGAFSNDDAPDPTSYGRFVPLRPGCCPPGVACGSSPNNEVVANVPLEGGPISSSGGGDAGATGVPSGTFGDAGESGCASHEHGCAGVSDLLLPLEAPIPGKSKHRPSHGPSACRDAAESC
jgi:hypothetical protein